MAVFPSLKSVWDLARKAEDLFKLQEKIEKLLSGHDERLRAVEDRLIQLERFHRDWKRSSLFSRAISSA